MRRSALAALLVALILPASAAARSISDFRGTGAWVDRKDGAVFANPGPAIGEMVASGVNTLYIQTGNYKLSGDIVHPGGLAAAIETAHAAGIRMVGWYLPGFANRDADFRRIMEAIDFTTPSGQHLDSYAIDIEATAIGSIGARNASMIKLSRRLRAALPADYALGAIVPDKRSSTIWPGLWPAFPFAAVRPYYDVVLPMAYSTYRGHGSGFVYRYTLANVRFMRAATGLPVHLIAGVADGLRPGEPAAAVRGARRGGAVGTSFYDLASSAPREWRAIASWPLPRPDPWAPESP
jgi:uncharacterized lipoprotein YddW (UPF0748 family)